MAKIKGKEGKIYDGSNQIGQIQNWSLDENMGLEDTTVMGDTAMTFTPNYNDAALNFDGFHDNLDAGQANLGTKLRAGTAISLTLILYGTKGSGTAYGFTGTMYIAKRTLKSAIKTTVTMTYQTKLSGILTESSTL